MKGARRQKTLGKNKPSQASLVSRGLAVNPAVVRYKDGEHSGPPSVQSGYSLYSSDSESTTTEVNQGLNRCAKLLANILDTSEKTSSLIMGHAAYRHQGKTSKSSKRPPKHHSSKHETKPTKDPQKNPVHLSKSTKPSQAKTHRTKSLKKKDAVTTTTSSEAKQAGLDVLQSSDKGSTVHIIPTGNSSVTDKPATKQGTAKAQPKSNRIPHVTAPGFQNRLMSSTPVERESPKKLTDTVVAPDKTTKPFKHQHRRQQLQPPTLAQKHLEVEHPVHHSSKETEPRSLRRKSPAQVKNKHYQGDLKGSLTEIEAPLKEGSKPDRDWMKWYEESVAKQTRHEAMVRGDSDPSSSKEQNGRQREHLSSSDTDRQPGVFPTHDTNQENHKVYQPLQDSQDLLRDLVRQLTILNQSDKNPVPVGNTQDLLQGLIQTGHHAQSERLPSGKNTSEELQEAINLPLRTVASSCQSLDSDQARVPQEDFQKGSKRTPLTQLLSEFRQIPPQQSQNAGQEDKTRSVSPVTLPVHAGPTLDPKYPSRNIEELHRLTKDDHTSSPQAKLDGASSPRVTFLTPRKDSLHDDSDISNQVSTPYIRQGSHGEQGHQSPNMTMSPPRSTGALLMDPRGQAVKLRTMQQIRTLKYLLGELQALLGDHGDLEVSRLLNELEEVCNTLPYTTQKQLLDLNTEVLLALQPLQSENAQLRRRLRIANHQLKSREMAEKENKDSTSVNLEALTLQALNSNLQKQLREERREKEELLRSNLEMSKTLEEKEQQHQNMLRILDDKDTNLLKSRQDGLKELEDLRSTRSELQSKVGYLELQIEGASKEGRILQLSLDQRDNEITRLKSLNQSLQEQVRKLTSQQNEHATSPRGLGGIGLQRMNRLLLERSPSKANKENIPSPSFQSTSVPLPSRKDLQPTKKQYEMPKPHVLSPRYDGQLSKSPVKSPTQQVAFTEHLNLRTQDISKWARTDTLWKGQQELAGDLISFESDEDLQENHRKEDLLDVSGEKQPAWTKDKQPSLHDLRSIYEVEGTSDRQQVDGNAFLKPSSSKRPENRVMFSLPNKDDLPRQEKEYTVGSRFSNELTYENNTLDFQPTSSTSKPGFGRELKTGFDGNPADSESFVGGASDYKSPLEVLGKPDTASEISDSTVSSITTQYEAQFQMGLRDLDAEIGKLQASLKYSALKPPRGPIT